MNTNTNSGLVNVLATGNITHYPAVCAKATASFAVLSDTINTIRSVLGKDATPLKKQIAALQKHEQQKLNFTAALHLEKIREKNESVGGQNTDADETADDRVVKLLRKGVLSLEQQIQATVESINEVLDELRCLLMESKEEEEEEQ